MIEKPRTPEATLDLCGAILDQARAYLGHGKPRDWRGQYHATRAALINQALSLEERARNVIRFAASLDPDIKDIGAWEDLAVATDVADYEDHLVDPYLEAINEWPGIRQGDGMGYWGARTPHGYGYTAGFNREAYASRYEAADDRAEYARGYHEGALARSGIERDLSGCPTRSVP